jgi:hypothetical protein
MIVRGSRAIGVLETRFFEEARAQTAKRRSGWKDAWPDE